MIDKPRPVARRKKTALLRLDAWRDHVQRGHRIEVVVNDT
jgi:hypothetical protein